MELYTRERAEIKEKELNEKLRNVGIEPTGEILKAIEKVGYSDPVHSQKLWRSWPWRVKGKIILTNKELIFLSLKKKQINFSVPINQIESIQPYVARRGSRKYKVCEIIYDGLHFDKMSVLFMSTISFRRFDFRIAELEFESMQLMAMLQKWYDTWVED